MKIYKFPMLLMFVALIALAGCSSGTSSSEDEPFVIRASNFYTESHTSGQAMNLFAEEVERLSDGRVEIQAFHNAELGDHAESIEGTLTGAIEITEAGNGGLEQFGVKGIHITEMPYLFDDFDDFKQILDNEEVRDMMVEFIEDQGFKLLGFRYFGPRITLANEPLRTFEDFQGVNLRSSEFEITVEMMEHWGANVVVTPLGEVYNSIQTGVVSGFESPVATLLTTQTFEVAKYAHMTNHIYFPGYLLMNKEYFDNLPSDIQEILLEAGRTSEEHHLQITEELAESELEELSSHGVEIIEYDDLSPFVDAIEDMRIDLAERMGPEAERLLNKITEVK